MLGLHQQFMNPMREIVWEAEGKDTFQIFIRSTRSNKRRYVSPAEINEFNFVLMKSNIRSYVIHAPYVMNPAHVDEEYRANAIRMIQSDIDFLASLSGKKYYVIHPGSHKGMGALAGLKLMTNTLKQIDPKGTTLCVENMAGGGTQLLSSPDEMDFLRVTTDFKFAFDTAHAFQAGYDPLEWYLRDKDRIAVVHLNNSATLWGSHNDIHENFVRGKMDPEYLKQLYSEIEESVPVILETPIQGQEADYAYLKIEV